MKYFDMFTGCAGFTVGIEKAYEIRRGKQELAPIIKSGSNSGGEGKQEQLENRGLQGPQPHCIGFSEIDKTANAILRFRYPDIKNYGDASTLTDLPDFDLLCGGFPCQSWSIAGKRRGFEDARGTLFYSIARVLADKRPGHFLLENVKGILSADGGKAVQEILRILTEIGYRVELVVLNSKDYGVPQNRERVFFVGHLADQCSREILSFGESSDDLIGTGGQGDNIAHTLTNGDKRRGSYDIASTDTAYALDANYGKRAADWKGRRTIVDSFTGEKMTANALLQMEETRGLADAYRVYDGDGLARTLKGEGGGLGAKTGLYSVERVPLKELKRNGKKTDGKYSFTVDTVHTGGVAVNKRIRRLTPQECAKLQGFDEEWADYGLFEKKEKWVVEAISDTGKYKVFGNAITTNVAEAIILKMLEAGCLEN